MTLTSIPNGKTPKESSAFTSWGFLALDWWFDFMVSAGRRIGVRATRVVAQIYSMLRQAQHERKSQIVSTYLRSP